eukprot:TRINITY_DN365_c0_g1_i2.p1 TRINITY_DN365_c0_g1~~TRINITY_DN365_c0_g1_i2.p1  ORF type:complete len:533 (+),score=35.26 TRINITY_DN365_c0_g1_i2:48-1646(+)
MQNLLSDAEVEVESSMEGLLADPPNPPNRKAGCRFRKLLGFAASGLLLVVVAIIFFAVIERSAGVAPALQASESRLLVQRIGVQCKSAASNIADGHSCADRVRWLMHHKGIIHEAVAGSEVAAQFPNECGPCGSRLTMPDSLVGAHQESPQLLCKTAALKLADGYSCEDRVVWLMRHGALDAAEAGRKVAAEFPSVCSECDSSTSRVVHTQQATPGPTWVTPAPTWLTPAYPTFAPSTAPTLAPSRAPSPPPTYSPSDAPTLVPSRAPSPPPTYSPSNVPTLPPFPAPSPTPTYSPSRAPYVYPSSSPSPAPSPYPSSSPSPAPSPYPSSSPSPAPTPWPFPQPTPYPTPSPTGQGPTQSPTSQGPTPAPSPYPSSSPSPAPSPFPSPSPSVAPSRSSPIAAGRFVERLCKSAATNLADGYSCEDRVTWLMQHGASDAAEAGRQVAAEFPSVCSECAASTSRVVHTQQATPGPTWVTPAPTWLTPAPSLAYLSTMPSSAPSFVPTLAPAPLPTMPPQTVLDQLAGELKSIIP